MIPLVSVITPTWQRNDLLLTRCLPSVQAQTYARFEHVVVVDGRDPVLEDHLEGLDGYQQLRWDALDEHDPGSRWGHWARLRAIEVARGDLIAYLDDDDAYRPRHVELLVDALTTHPEADFAYSQMNSNGATIGNPTLDYCQVGTPMIMHRRGLLQYGSWEQSMPSIDWDLVKRWLAAGAQPVFVPEITVDVWPSTHR